MTKTLAQKRAADAFEKVNVLTQKYDGDWQGKYASYARNLPATIIMNGLGQAAATLLAQDKGKKETAHYVLYQHLQDWLCGKHTSAPYQGAKNLMTAITKNNRHTYIQAQAEALAWLEWLKKFATAYLKQKEGDS